MNFICGSGSARKRVKITIRSASLERLQAGDVVVDHRIDGAFVRVDGEQHGALEAVMFAEDFRQLR